MITGTAIILDKYFESHPVIISELDADNKEESKEQHFVYLISQNISLNVKTPLQNTSSGRFLSQAHSKLIQFYHHKLNIQAYKNKKEVQHSPVYLQCHILLFNQSYFSYPDEDPLI